MENSEKLIDFKKEFSEEINSVSISCDDLKKYKISSDILAAETYLRKIFGDEIYETKSSESEVSGEKQIEKLNEDELDFDNKVRQICENLNNSEFDQNLSLILARTNTEE